MWKKGWEAGVAVWMYAIKAYWSVVTQTLHTFVWAFVLPKCVPQLLATFILSVVCFFLCVLLSAFTFTALFSKPLSVYASVCNAEDSGASGVELANVVCKELQSMLWSQWPPSRWETLQQKTPQVPPASAEHCWRLLHVPLILDSWQLCCRNWKEISVTSGEASCRYSWHGSLFVLS